MDNEKKNGNGNKKTRCRKKLPARNSKNIGWIIFITVLSFFLSVILSFVSSSILKDVSIIIAFLVVFIIILINIVFDIIGVAVTAAEEKPFHGMSARKLKAADESIRLIRNADKVSNFCSDVVGDICGIISGAAGAYIAIKILQTSINAETSLASLSITACVAALTVGGKGIGKTIAINNSDFIVYRTSVVVKFLKGNFNRNKSNTKKKIKK